jgi:imidazole glycerol-phosphate synthase subunit HisH
MTTGPSIALLDYGVGNLHSAAKALHRAGATVRTVADVASARDAAGPVVPGVGAYGACLRGLDTAGGAGAIRDWLATGRPLLGVCVGMQLLFQASEEGPVDDGVGVLPGRVRRLAPASPKIPHIGWDEIDPRPDSRLFKGLGPGTRFYFVHSYAPGAGGDHVAATCDYGGTWGAAVESGNLFGTQFHPEKSGAAGLALLANFVDACH